jgi:hypothetical protein
MQVLFSEIISRNRDLLVWAGTEQEPAVYVSIGYLYYSRCVHVMSIASILVYKK